MGVGNVLLITLDQFRADCLSTAGHRLVRTPAIDALGADGVRFAHHFNQCAPLRSEPDVDPRIVTRRDDPRLRNWEGVCSGFDVALNLDSSLAPWGRWLATRSPRTSM